MEITAITICVNYSDILKHMLKQNSQFFKVWYIVTSQEDTLTQTLIQEFNLDNVKILIYDDFYKNNSKFNKGGALEFAQKYIDENHKDTNILILDADIYLPDHFMKSLPEKLEENTLYGVKERWDYPKLEDFIENKNAHKYTHGGNFVGFFQLYNQSCSYKYENSYNASSCDLSFLSKFHEKKHIEVSVRHMGEECVNWDGRVHFGIF